MNVRQEYYRLRRNLLAKNYRLRKKGKQEIKLPKIPKKITEKSIAKLNRLSKPKKKKATSSVKKPAGRRAPSSSMITADSFISIFATVRSYIVSDRQDLIAKWDAITSKYKTQIVMDLEGEPDPEIRKQNLEAYDKILIPLKDDIDRLLMLYNYCLYGPEAINTFISVLQKHFDSTLKIRISSDMLISSAQEDFE